VDPTAFKGPCSPEETGISIADHEVRCSHPCWYRIVGIGIYSPYNLAKQMQQYIIIKR